jgi:hypothetical protein
MTPERKAYLDALVATFPPPTPEQQDLLARVFGATGGRNTYAGRSDRVDSGERDDSIRPAR